MARKERGFKTHYGSRLISEVKQQKCHCIIDPDKRIVCEHTIEKCGDPDNPFGGLVKALLKKMSPHAELCCNKRNEALRRLEYGASKHGDVDLENQVLAAQPGHSDAPSHDLSTFNVVASTCQERGERSILSLPCLTVAIHDYVLCADIGAWLTLRLAAVRHSRCQALARWISLHSQKPPTPCIFTA